MRETWINWILNRTTQAQRVAVLLVVGACLVALAIFMCHST